MRSDPQLRKHPVLSIRLSGTYVRQW